MNSSTGLTNKAIANILDDIADMLEIMGEIRFKIQAYQRAANQIRSSAQDITKMESREELDRIPGVGKGIAEKIDELIKTGHLQYYEELKEQVAPSVLQIMEVPSVGPKKAKLFYDQLGILSVDELLQAAQDHNLQALPGISSKTEDNIIAGIEQLRAHHERELLFEALPIAEELIDELRSMEMVIQADFAGSLRRMRETIGDIDILASSKEPEAVSRAFCSGERVDRILAQGETKCSVITKGGQQVDLRIIDPGEYGAALIYFTGSQQHNIRIRDLAKRLGYKLNEYGLFRIDDDSLAAGKTEEDVYTKLGLQFIPAELREDRGEIQAAAENTLPSLIELYDIKGDLHVHSDFSDGINSIDEIVAYARKMGYKYVGLSDHALNLKVARGLSIDRLKERRRRIDEVNSQHSDFKVLSGIELNIDNDGNLDYPDAVLAEFDITIASVHTGFGQSEAQLTERIIKAMQNPFVQIIGHPTGRVLGRRFAYQIDIAAVLDAAAETGTIMELNSFPDRLDLNDEHLRLAKEKKVRIAIGTDAHVSEQMRYIRYGIGTARRGWIEKGDVLNTQSLKKLPGWLKKV